MALTLLKSNDDCSEDLEALVAQLARHNFNIRRHADGNINNEFGRIETPLFILGGGTPEMKRLTDLIIEFYDHEEIPQNDTSLTAVVDQRVFDQAVDICFEFDFEFSTLGADILVKLPPEIMSIGTRAQILERYHQEFAKFGRFLELKPVQP